MGLQALEHVRCRHGRIVRTVHAKAVNEPLAESRFGPKAMNPTIVSWTLATSSSGTPLTMDSCHIASRLSTDSCDRNPDGRISR
jgi:hypothetical protein